MADPQTDTCDSCRWWRVSTMTSYASGNRLGNCVKRAPMVFQLKDGKLASKWPMTAEDDFCGQHKLAPIHAFAEASNG